MLRWKIKFDKVEDQKRELKQQMISLREEHKDLSDEEFAKLEGIIQLRANYEELDPPASELLEQFNLYKNKLAHAEEAPRATRSWMEKNWGFVMAENNLLEPPGDSDDGSDDGFVQHPNHDSFSHVAPEPTSSELAREEVYNDLQVKRDRIIALEEIVNNWQKHYDNELFEYLAAVEDRTCGDSRTVSDLCLLEESQEKIGELVPTGKEYDQALLEARTLGIGLEDDSTVSYTPSSHDDGYTLSFENEMTTSIDKRWIEAWVDEIEDEDPDLEPEGDDWNEWDVKSKGQNERDSVVYDMMARGKVRKKIDEWREKCNAIKLPGMKIPSRTAGNQSFDSSDYPSAESSPFLTTPLSA